MTEAATRFVAPLTFETLSSNPVVQDLWNPALEKSIGGDVEHIGLVRWADFAILAPATLNTLGKIAQGQADDALSTFFAAFPASRSLLAPAMNTGMWKNPAMVENLTILETRGYLRVGPGSGELACGDDDEGRMAEPEEILEALVALSGRREGLLSGKKVLLSAGPTREALDPVRYLSNPSTGTMGLALARAAWIEGADVSLVAGPGVGSLEADIERCDVTSAEEMAEALLSRADDADLVFMAAAVADYRPAQVAEDKMQKVEGDLNLLLERTTDILMEMKHRKLTAFRVGFAMETGDPQSRALAKLESKGLDLIVANDLREEGAGFGRDSNRVTVFGPDGFRQEYPLMDKWQLASELISLAAERSGSKRGAANG